MILTAFTFMVFVFKNLNQRNGVEKRLFDCCKQKDQEQKCKMFKLGIWGFNKDSIAFYENCGMTDRIRRMEYGTVK